MNSETVEPKACFQAQDIIQALAMPQLLAALGFPPLRHNRTRCLVHGGDSLTSVSVNSEKGLWHCHVCHEGGGKLRLAERVLNCDRKQALRYLADLAGIRLEEYTEAQTAEWRRQRAEARVEGDAFYCLLKERAQALRDSRDGLFSTYHGAKRYVLANPPSEGDLRWELAASVLERYDRIEALDGEIDYLENVANYPDLLKLYREQSREAA